MNSLRQSLTQETKGTWIVENHPVDITVLSDIEDVQQILMTESSYNKIFDCIHPASLYGILRNKNNFIKMFIVFDGYVKITLRFASEWGGFEEFYQMSEYEFEELMEYCNIKRFLTHNWLKEGF